MGKEGFEHPKSPHPSDMASEPKRSCVVLLLDASQYSALRSCEYLSECYTPNPAFSSYRSAPSPANSASVLVYTARRPHAALYVR